MSRAPPFPTRRPRSPSINNGNGPQGIRPLQISRPPSRPTTPSNVLSSSYTKGNTTYVSTDVGPSRPQRSELRNRTSEASEVNPNPSRDFYRDSVSTTRSDASSAYRQRSAAPTTPSLIGKSRSPRANGITTDEDLTTSPALSNVISAFQAAGARKRAMTNGSQEMEYQRERQLEAEAEGRRQQRIRDKAPGRQTTGKARIGDIDAVLDQIKDGWEFVVDPDFSTVDLALQLLDDSSSVGKDMDSFQRTKAVLSKTLKGSVDKHYQAFAASLPHQASLINHLGTTQSEISAARTSLQEAKDALGNKRADLVQLWSRGETLEEMMRLLDQIEHLKAVPDLLETLMSEKRLLQAAVLLVRSLKTINKQDMLEIGAVTDLRSYLNNQETALRDILVDELHSHIYLKSFWCESRWAAYVPNQSTLPRVEYENDASDPPPARSHESSEFPPSRPFRLTRFLDDLAIRPNDPPLDMNEPNIRHSGLASTGLPSMGSRSNISLPTSSAQAQLNPEADSFSYIDNLLESLAVLGRLGSALDTVAQRLPNEIYNLVESTVEEASERAEYGRRISTFSLTGNGRTNGIYILSDGLSAAVTLNGVHDTPRNASLLRLAALESSSRQVDQEILKDLFWTVYSKLDAVAQGLRVVYEVANRIGSRRDFKDSSGAKPGALFPLSEIWNSVQTEVRTLISDYITDEEQGSVSGRNPISSINEILREGKFSREKHKPGFRFADTDFKLVTKSLKSCEEELMSVLRDTMPGLVQGSSESSVQTTLSSVGSDDRLLGVGQRHRLLIRPDAFHVTVLFQPTLCFLDRVVEVLPSGLESARASSTVLDDFVLKVYLPQLEEKVALFFHDAVTGPEAFLPDPLSTQLCPQPLVKASTHLMALINSLCTMLQTSPFHRENYTRLILGVIIQFYQRCSDRFQDLVTLAAQKDSNNERRLAIAAQWAQRADLTACLGEIWASHDTDTTKHKKLFRQELNFELELLGTRTIEQVDLISSTRNFTALCCLHRSVSWFATALVSLKSNPDGPISPTTPLKLEPLTATTPYTPYLPTMPSIPSSDGLKLPLSKEMSLRFQALLKTYEQLAELILYTLRIDLRCRVIHHIYSAMHNGNYVLEQEPSAPDPSITDLTTQFDQCEDSLSLHLTQREQRFLFSGIEDLMEHSFIAGARYLKLVNSFGIKKIMRNVQALQQSIKTISHDSQIAGFEQTKRYYSLFPLVPRELLDKIRQKAEFTFDEYQTMLSIQCGVVPSEGEAGVAQAADRNYSMYMIELHAMEIGS